MVLSSAALPVVNFGNLCATLRRHALLIFYDFSTLKKRERGERFNVQLHKLHREI